MDSCATPPPLPSEVPLATTPPPLPPRGVWAAFLLGLAGTAVLLLAQVVAAALFAGVESFRFFVTHHRAMSASAVERLASNPSLIAFCVFASLPVLWLALYAMVRIQRGGRFAEFLGLRGFRWTQLLIWVPILAIVLIGSNWILVWLGAKGSPEFTLNLLLDDHALSWVVAAIVLGAPLVEEPLFRGFMYRGMARSRWTLVAALIVPNLLWVLLHFQYRWPSLIVLFFVGLVFALSRHFSGSTLLPILLHFGLNAAAVFAALSQLHPTGPHGIDLSRATVLASLMRADQAKKSGDDTAALAAYTAALAVDPKNPDALEKRALLHQRADDIDPAVADFTSLLEVTTDVARIRYLRARALTFKDDYDGAISDLDRSISVDAKAYRAYALRGWAWNQKGDHRRAIADNQAALRLNPDFVPALRNLADAYLDVREYDHATAQLGRVIRLSPRAFDYFNRAFAHGKEGRQDRAIADLSAAIRLSPRYAAAYCNRAFAWQQKRAYRKAFVDYERSLELDPDDAITANSFAWMLATCPDPIFRDGALAVRYAEQACKDTDWENAAYLDTLAAAYAEKGDFARAIWWQERCLELPDPDAEAKLRLTRYRRHQAYTE